MRCAWHRCQRSQHWLYLVVDGAAAHGAVHVSSVIARHGSRGDGDTCASKLSDRVS